MTATQPSTPPAPFISASAVGDTRTVPDRASIAVALETQGESAAKAGGENAARQARVIDAVKALGIAAAQIRTSGYHVSPEYAHDRGKSPRITSYRASNSVQIEVRDVELVGKVIDAALGAGANNIGSVAFYSSNTDNARMEAVQQAVTRARTEAEAAATAVGGSLGALVELTIEPSDPPQPLTNRMFAAAAVMDGPLPPTPVESGEIVVQAFVRARWQFVAAER